MLLYLINLNLEKAYHLLVFNTLAGTPPTTTLSSTSLITNDWAPTITLLPILTPPITFAPQQISTLSPIIGRLSPL